MNIKKFMAMGLVSVCTLVGCSSAQESESNAVDSNITTETVEQKVETEAKIETTTETDVKTEPEVEETVAKPEVDPAEEKKKTAAVQVQALASLIGKKAEEVDAILGEPASVQNLEDSEILLVRFYKVEYLNEIAKIEVVFNDVEQTVNYVSFVILKADDITATKENIATTLTELYGESTIERYLDVKGRQNRNWYDDNLTYDLTYYGDNIALDIYPTDK